MSRTAEAVLEREEGTPLNNDSVVEGLKQYYQLNHEEYHLTYPRLLAKGQSPKQIAEELGKEIDVVEFHIDRLYGCIPSLKRNPKRSELLAEALKALDAWPRPPRPASETSDVGRRFSLASLNLKAHTSDSRVGAKPPKQKPDAVPALDDSSYTGAEPDDPDEETLRQLLNGLPRGKRKMLDVIMTFEQAPQTADLLGLLGDSENSINSRVSTLFAHDLRLPSRDKRKWKKRQEYRHALLRSIYTGPGILAAQTRSSALRAPPPSRTRPHLLRLSPLDRALLDVLVTFETPPEVKDLLGIGSKPFEQWVTRSIETLYTNLRLPKPDGCTDADWALFRHERLRSMILSNDDAK